MAHLVRGFLELPDSPHTGGRNGELQTMLDRDMTLAEAVRHHISEVWNLDGGNEIFNHEAGHVVLGLALNAPPYHALAGHAYQGSYEAEIYNLEIEHLLNSTTTGKQKELFNNRQEFIMGVLARYREFSVQENLMRTLGWLMERQTGQSYEELRSSVDYNDQKFREKAEGMGITVTRSENMKSWTVSAPGFDEPFFFLAPGEHFLPGDLEGVDDFQPFERPHVSEICEVYERVLPALHMMQNEVFALDREAAAQSGQSFGNMSDRAMGSLKIRDLYREIVARKAEASPSYSQESAPG